MAEFSEASSSPNLICVALASSFRFLFVGRKWPILDALLQRFEVQAPVATMVRAITGNVLAAAQLNEMFRDNAVDQCEGE